MPRLLVVEIHSLKPLVCQIWRETFKDSGQKDFKMGRTKLPGNPRQRRQDFKEFEQYPLAPTSISKK